MKFWDTTINSLATDRGGHRRPARLCTVSPVIQHYSAHAHYRRLFWL